MVHVCLALVWVLVCGCTLSRSQISQDDIPECRGVFDFYFVLDSSGSVSSVFHTEIVPFVGNVTINFVNPNFQVAFITFASTAVIHLNLTRTADKDAIQAGLTSLDQFNPNGGTQLSNGLQLVNDEISSQGGDRASVILVLTDGQLGDLSNSQQQASLARSRGARIFAVGIGNVNRRQLVTIVDTEDQLYIGSDFQYLDAIINQIVNETCIEITAVDPPRVCLSSTMNITLTGRGFTNQLNQNQAACRFKISEDEFLLTSPTEQIQYHTIICPAPQLNHTGELLLQVTLNGISFISSNVTMEISECLPEDLVFLAGVALGLFALFALFALLALCLLWFFFPLITGKIVGGLPPEPKKPKSKRSGKWAAVDASYYGRGGAGGIAPVTVRWGDAGATEAGNKLTKAKDANIVTNVKEPRTPTPRRAGCCDLTKRKLNRWYAVASSYRPVRGPTKHVLWFPGPCSANYQMQARNVTATEETSYERSTSASSPA